MQSRDNIVLSGHAFVDLTELASGLIAFNRELFAAQPKLFAALLVKKDSIFGSIQFQRGLADLILGLPQLCAEFVDATVTL